MRSNPTHFSVPSRALRSRASLTALALLLAALVTGFADTAQAQEEVAPDSPRATGLGDQEMAGCLQQPGDLDEYFFQHQITVFIDGKTWYFQAPELELNFNQNGQPQDLPGHCWQPGQDVDGFKRFIGKHYNTGPLAAGGGPKFWSSDAGEHEQLYWVDAVITPWSPKIALSRARQGYVHYHELVQAGDGCYHPTLVIWMRHTALTDFTFDGGPPQFRENGLPFRPRNIPHRVQPGVDYAFPPNYDVPYLPELICGPEASDR
jgi:hypothetical protein